MDIYALYDGPSSLKDEHNERSSHDDSPDLLAHKSATVVHAVLNLPSHLRALWVRHVPVAHIRWARVARQHRYAS